MMEDMVTTGLEIYTERSLMTRGVRFFLVTHQPPSFKPSLGTAITFEEHEEGFRFERPTFELLEKRAQQLFDQLWGAGFRPTDAGSAHGQLQAMDAHLQDMRMLVADKLKVPLAFNVSPAGALR